MSDELKPVYQDDEIDLFELIETLWKEKIWIIFFTVLAALGGGGYAFLATPTYEAEVRLLPSTTKDLAELSKLSGVSVSAEVAFTRTIQTMQSREYLSSFFALEDVSSYFNPERLTLSKVWKDYTNAFVVSPPAKNSAFAAVKVATSDPELSAEFANLFVRLAVQATRDSMVADFEEARAQKLESIQTDIDSRTAIFTSRLEVELLKLKEARAVAEKVGLETERDVAVVFDGPERMMVDEVRRLYRLGTVAIDAEMEALEARKKLPELVPGMIGLKQQAELTSSITLDVSKIVPAVIDLKAFPPAGPIKPRKALILALSIVLGGMLGVLFVLIRSAVRKRKAA